MRFAEARPQAHRSEAEPNETSREDEGNGRSWLRECQANGEAGDAPARRSDHDASGQVIERNASEQAENGRRADQQAECGAGLATELHELPEEHGSCVAQFRGEDRAGYE